MLAMTLGVSRTNHREQLAIVCFLVATAAAPSLAFAPMLRVVYGQVRPITTRQYLFDFLKPDDKEGKAAAENEKVEPAGGTSDDPVDKIFSFFFGEKEENPMGMKRFGRGAKKIDDCDGMWSGLFPHISLLHIERFPEQYPAVLDEWAEPVASDDEEMAALRPLLKKTNLEFRELKLTYSANRDGWDASKFHKKVDRLGGGLVVCTTKDGLVCGGCKCGRGQYLLIFVKRRQLTFSPSDNPKGWVGYGEARGSIAAFLFVYKRGLKELPTKLRKVGGPSLAQQDLPEIGPSFGADSLVIPFETRSPKIARSKLGSYYERFPDGTNTLFGKRGGSVELKDLKVYHGVYGPDEYIPFTDAEPFALY